MKRLERLLIGVSLVLSAAYIISYIASDKSCVICSIFFAEKQETIKDAEVNATTTDILVKRVIDGDTIELATGERVRYIGIDTPETVDPREEVGCFGKEASQRNKELVEGKKVRLEKDVSDLDSFGRLLRYVYAGDEFVNLTLVQEGYARASSYPPDIKYQEIFRTADAEARQKGSGLWGECR